MWRLKVPSIIHILWLLANNKTLSRDNLAKRKKVDDMTCVFYNELQSFRHLFFDCCVAQAFCKEISEIVGLPPVGSDFEHVAKLWLPDKKFKITNVCTSATLWTINLECLYICYLVDNFFLRTERDYIAQQYSASHITIRPCLLQKLAHTHRSL
jgi:hypothetical protein